MLIRNITDLARYFGVDESGTEHEVMQRMDRALYKSTACGAFIHLKMDGVLIGSIVEGSDTEFSNFLRFPFSEMAFDDTLEWLEAACNEEWHAANEEEYEDQ